MIDWEKRFKEKSALKHDNKYYYDKVAYKNAHEKVCVICPVHGEFMVTPNAHLRGVGCPKCNGGVSFTIEEFIKKAKEAHGDKYDYSKVDLKNRLGKTAFLQKTG